MKIFVANLNFNLQEDTLKEIFEAHGTVESARIITDRNSGRSKGFGFVDMPDDDEASSAIEALNNTEVEGRNLIVKESEEKPQRPRFTNRRPDSDRY
jgi:RNA recognition motif-containing protein